MIPPSQRILREPEIDKLGRDLIGPIKAFLESPGSTAFTGVRAALEKAVIPTMLLDIGIPVELKEALVQFKRMLAERGDKPASLTAAAELSLARFAHASVEAQREKIADDERRHRKLEEARKY